jgi:hypothetical protein
MPVPSDLQILDIVPQIRPIRGVERIVIENVLHALNSVVQIMMIPTALCQTFVEIRKMALGISRPVALLVAGGICERIAQIGLRAGNQIL